MNVSQKEAIEKLLDKHLIVSTGCTEPIAIAYAVATAKKYLKEVPDEVNLKISINMAKNAMYAGIPNAKYKGAAFVASLGALYADSEDGFQLLENLTPEQHEKAYIYSKEKVKIDIADNNKALYIEVEVKLKQKSSITNIHNLVRVVIEDEHTNIKEIEIDGEKVILHNKDCLEEKKKILD